MTATTTLQAPPTVRWSPDEIAGLTRAFGVRPGRRSPLRPLLDKSQSPAPEAQLRRSGWLDERWRRALEVLAEPDSQAKTIVAGVTHSVTSVWYGRRERPAAPMASLQPDGDVAKVAYPWRPEDIALLAVPALMDPMPLSTPDAPEVSLSPAALTAFASSVDVLRARRLESLYRRKAETVFQFTRAEAMEQLERGSKTADGRWLVSLIQLLAPKARKLHPAVFDEGLDELSSADLIEGRGDRFTPRGFLHSAATQWRDVLPAMSHEAISLAGDELQSCEARITIRGSGPLWVLDFGDLAVPNQPVRMRNVRPAEELEQLAEMFRLPARAAPGAGEPASAEETKAPATEPKAERRCPQCGHLPRPGVRFCTRCGGALPASA